MKKYKYEFIWYVWIGIYEPFSFFYTPFIKTLFITRDVRIETMKIIQFQMLEICVRHNLLQYLSLVKLPFTSNWQFNSEFHVLCCIVNSLGFVFYEINVRDCANLSFSWLGSASIVKVTRGEVALLVSKVFESLIETPYSRCEIRKQIFKVCTVKYTLETIVWGGGRLDKFRLNKECI